MGVMGEMAVTQAVKGLIMRESGLVNRGARGILPALSLADSDGFAISTGMGWSHGYCGGQERECRLK